MSRTDRDGVGGGGHKNRLWERDCEWYRTGLYRVIDIRRSRRAAKRECRDVEK